MRDNKFNPGDIVIYYVNNLLPIIVQVEKMNTSLTFMGRVVYSESPKTKVGFLSSGWSTACFDNIQEEETEKYNISSIEIMLQALQRLEDTSVRKKSFLAKHGL